MKKRQASFSSLRASSHKSLGDRICIIGPSSSGKSTLADYLGARLNIPVHHLDQIAYIADTDWERRFDKDFIADHSKILHQDRWIIDGNYSVTMNERFQSATAVIWLDQNLMQSMLRYLKRSFLDKAKNRKGGLKGAKSEFNPKLISYTFKQYPKNKIKYQSILNNHPDLKIVIIKNMRELKAFYLT